ncbi:alanyl-tRNA editing protein AlaXM [Staphylothermus hellenicus]|uniref:Threonyl/alanyl tRNA synthetase SAD n=1 Tax=Staphylothermus hellenicus (strain DSM 12710 / JCM 10830 / BK20S6-10-b1 / P8) TaxID=591019 RepID=D7D9H4_STAHD|nr:alanyl-tRNA editing protein AlaXM [Staphylothermus hellenicus]ADI32420.1 Threonyl/alanyl tRNA synthetase SAD [Staphylothermus hellenicus DSM 12710]
MTTKLLYQYDSYLKENIARVREVIGNKIVFNTTIFHPRSGGVDHDTGKLVKDGGEYRVVQVLIDKNIGDVVHIVDGEHDLKVGDVVKQVIDWNRRYKLMRLHTAAHILASIMYNEHGALITGGNISEEYAYDDYSLEEFNKELFLDIVEKANQIIKRNIEVKIYWLPREEALKIPGIVKLAKRTPPNIDVLRIVEIPGVDIQADGGPHVKNTGEIGEIVPLKIVNKGRKRKRLYYTVKP